LLQATENSKDFCERAWQDLVLRVFLYSEPLVAKAVEMGLEADRNGEKKD
jgi:hypothetical protein